MELKTQAQALYNRFAANNTLGPDAQKCPMNFEESVGNIAGNVMAVALDRHDNSAMDLDTRPGFVRYDRPTFEKTLNEDLVAQLPGLAEPTVVSPEEMNSMVELGLLTREEADKMLEQQTNPPAPKQGQIAGEVRKDAEGTIFAALETTGGEHEMNYLVARQDGDMTLLTVVPTDSGFKAQAQIFKGGDCYKEILEGDWNLAQ